MAYFVAMKQSPPNEKKIVSLRRKLMFFFPLSLISVIGAHAYESMHDFPNRLKEM
jgi:hypothetical protein